nr:hypothetical protein [uncultured Flavobacterium sp.]
MPLKERSPEIKKILLFLDEIGLQTIEKKLENTFLPGLSLGPDCLYIDFEKLLYPGDILHEAGHLAVATSEERKLAGTPEMSPEWPPQSEEIGAILWSFAAANHLELPLEFVFHPNGYKNASEWFISNFSNKSYIGLPFLQWIGLTLGEEKASEEKKESFPIMQKWLRD